MIGPRSVDKATICRDLADFSATEKSKPAKTASTLRIAISLLAFFWLP